MTAIASAVLQDERTPLAVMWPLADSQTGQRAKLGPAVCRSQLQASRQAHLVKTWSCSDTPAPAALYFLPLRQTGTSLATWVRIRTEQGVFQGSRQRHGPAPRDGLTTAPAKAEVRSGRNECPLFSKAVIRPRSAQCPLCAKSGHSEAVSNRRFGRTHKNSIFKALWQFNSGWAAAASA